MNYMPPYLKLCENLPVTPFYLACILDAALRKVRTVKKARKKNRFYAYSQILNGTLNNKFACDIDLY